MSKHTIEIKEIEKVTHDVLEFETEKPDGYDFKPGQATKLSMDKKEWRDEKRPFTFTSLPKEDNLKFTIKTYPERDGMTDQLREIEEGEEFIIKEPWGAITFQGKGYFIAGGAGVTPFLSILRKLREENQLKGNKLLFSNKTERDIILKDELREMLGDDFVNILSREDHPDYPKGHIDKEFLDKHCDDKDKKFYVCGPPQMVQSVVNDLMELGVDEDDIILEE